MAQSKLVTKRADGWYWRRGSSAKFSWVGPYATKHVAMKVRERATGGAWGYGNDAPATPAPAAAAPAPAAAAGSYGNKRKKDMTTRAFKARRARARATRVGSRYRDPNNGQFA